MKQNLSNNIYAVPYTFLIQQADSLLKTKHISVIEKQKLPPSGDIHDYLCIDRYWWPDTTKANGLPYIHKDGLTNPEINLYDRDKIERLRRKITTLSLAYFLSENEIYAKKAVEQLRTWFLTASTKMNPHFEYAAIRPGHDNEQSFYGIIHAVQFLDVIESVKLLKKSSAFTNKDETELILWFKDLLTWLINSESGKKEGAQKNNHGTSYDMMLIAFMLYTNQPELAEPLINQFPENRVFKQIEPDGKQPKELGRTLSFHYSIFNLGFMVRTFFYAQQQNISLINRTSSEGINVYKGIDFIVQHADSTQWKYNQIISHNNFYDDLAKLAYMTYLLDKTKIEYLHIYQYYSNYITPTDLFNLVYLQSYK